jgi:hypothetical protein
MAAFFVFVSELKPYSEIVWAFESIGPRENRTTRYYRGEYVS